MVCISPWVKLFISCHLILYNERMEPIIVTRMHIVGIEHINMRKLVRKFKCEILTEETCITTCLILVLQLTLFGNNF